MISHRPSATFASICLKASGICQPVSHRLALQEDGFREFVNTHPPSQANPTANSYHCGHVQYSARCRLHKQAVSQGLTRLQPGINMLLCSLYYLPVLWLFKTLHKPSLILKAPYNPCSLLKRSRKNRPTFMGYHPPPTLMSFASSATGYMIHALNQSHSSWTPSPLAPLAPTPSIRSFPSLAASGLA